MAKHHVIRILVRYDDEADREAIMEEVAGGIEDLRDSGDMKGAIVDWEWQDEPDEEDE